ncbi:MAG TPA: 4Fe-4S cluster-binding domain-containing protein, partial [Rhodocyclaceae bacterium]|nr:4Fe-4S cluster-binding domain-containing protein [Rhodocyclaceae bacterium]
MKIAVNKAHFPVTVLGPGRRIGLWLQGCSIRCKGCVSRDTWEPDPAKAMTVASLLAWCRRTTGGVLDGVTISGGEPFDQPAALAALLDGLQRWRRELARPFDLLCYSGHPLKTLRRDHADILARLDALIPEPYSDGRPLGGLWRGSDNQPLVPLSPLGEARYREAIDAPAASQDKRMQVAVEAGRLWFIGIPHRGDMAALE